MTPPTGRVGRSAAVLAAVAALLAATVLGGCAGSQAITRADAGGDGRCLLLTTNDSEAHFDGARQSIDPLVYLGTLARIAAVKAQRLAERPGGVLLVSAGDVLQGRYMERQDGDRARAAKEAWQLYEAAGYDVGTLGNHEFDAGPLVLRDALRALSRYRIVVSNLAADSPTLDNRDGRLWDEVALRDCGGIKVGFFGLLTPSTRTISQFGDTRFKDEDDPVLPAARAAIAKLRADGAEVVVAITHLGVDDDVELAGKLADAPGGVDVIVGGHSHTLTRKWRKVGRTLVVQSGQRFSHLGHLELVRASGGGLDGARSSWRVVPVDQEMPVDAAVAAKVEALRAAYEGEAVIGERKVPWVLRGWGRRIYGKRVARALWRYSAAQNKAALPVDAAIINSGGLRTAVTYPPGKVTNLEVRAVHPFGNRAVLVELSGATLRDALEHACSGGKGRSGGERIEVWGLRFRCDASKPGVSYRFEAGKAIAIAQRGERVLDLEVGGVAVDEGKVYRVATNDYIARGGSGFWSMTQGARSCLDGAPFEPGNCKGQVTMAQIVEAGVRDGSFDAALPE